MDPRFEIFLQISLSEKELLQLIVSSVPGASRPPDSGYVYAQGYAINLEKNAEYDPKKASEDASDAWEYFRYHCNAFPTSGNKGSELEQIASARQLSTALLDVFRASNGLAELDAEFAEGGLRK